LDFVFQHLELSSFRVPRLCFAMGIECLPCNLATSVKIVRSDERETPFPILFPIIKANTDEGI